MLIVFFLFADSPKIEGIEGNRPLREGDIRVSSGFIGLPGSQSGWSEMGPSLIRDSVFFAYIFHIFSPYGADSRFQMYRTQTDTQKEKG